MYTKQAVLALLFAGASAKIHYVDTSKAELIIKGVLEGAIQAEGLDDIEHCITDAKVVIADAEIAVKDFEKRDAKDVVAGLKEVAHMLVAAKSAVSECKGVKGDFEKIAKMAAALSNPASFAYHVGKDLIVNGRSIYHEVDTAIGDYKKADWEGFGVNVGEAAAKTILGEVKPTSEAGLKFASVLQGVIKAFGGEFSLQALLECIGDEDKAALVIDQAFEKFQAAYKEKNTKDAISGVILTVVGIMQAKNGLAACESIEKTSWDFQGFLTSEKLMSSPTKFFEVIGKDVLINGYSIIKGIETSYADIETFNYEKFGEDTGAIMKLASQANKKDELFIY